MTLGSARLPTAHVRTVEDTITTSDMVRIQVQTSLWFNWARIAVEQEREARRHRAAWNDGTLRDISYEMHASMIAMVAVPLALDALHAVIAPTMGRDADPVVSRKSWAYMRETFRIAASPRVRGWQEDFAWVFTDVRKVAVHGRTEMHDPVPHPGRRMTDKVGKQDADYHHLILLAKDDVGYRNLLALATAAHLGGSRDRRPQAVGKARPMPSRMTSRPYSNSFPKS